MRLTVTLPATLYARYSNIEQGAGDSKTRQLRLCREMAASNGWDVAEDRIFVDEGKSAYSGANRQPGGLLYEFEQQAKAGHYQNGHVLVVENLDRISRQGYEEILPLLQNLTSQGVTVATTDNNRIYPAYERVEMVAVIEAVLKSELAREESLKKSRRNLSAWQRKVAVCSECGGRLRHEVTVKKGQARKKRGKSYVSQNTFSYLFCNAVAHRISDDGAQRCTNEAKIR